jgi:hypothetical protein
MIEIDKDNPPQHFDLTPKELLQRISQIPNLKLGWGDLIFLRELLEQHVESRVELHDRKGVIRVTMFQPNDAGKAILEAK